MLKVDKNLCQGCGLCARVCPQGAINLIWGKAEIDPRRCNSCYQCVDACPQGAILEMVVVSPKKLRSTVSSLRQQTDDILAKLNALYHCGERVSRSPERSEGDKAISK
jgi:formate hydrogenlyase subunit 6/NADH:ubiquinone oxidoreductase subunit I